MFSPKPYQRYLRDQGITYSSSTITLNVIGRSLAICYERLKEDSELSEGKEMKRKSKGDDASSSAKKLKSDDEWKKPKSSDPCPLHRGHLWGDCTDNPWCPAYIPRAPYSERVNKSRGKSNQTGKFNTNSPPSLYYQEAPQAPQQPPQDLTINSYFQQAVQTEVKQRTEPKKQNKTTLAFWNRQHSVPGF